MKNIFECVRDKIFHGMPSGCLVTKDKIDFDIGMWQHKTYDVPVEIYKNLRSKWTSHTINLIIMNEEVSVDDIKAFITINDYDVSQRAVYNVNCISFPNKIITNDFCDWLASKKYIFNRYRTKILCGEHVIFLSDFIKNILLY